MRRLRKTSGAGRPRLSLACGGGTKAQAGIIGLATIVGEAEHRGHDAPERCADPKLLRPKLRIVVRLEEVRPAHPIPRAVVK
ncbi:hypothetical protein EON81_21410, partial [bacterium]